MKKIIIILSVVFIAFSCDQNAENSETTTEVVATEELKESQNFGATITEEGAIPAGDLITVLEGKDSVVVKIKGTIEDVCQKKGCWMNVDMNEEYSVFVKFKDYEFFVPKDAAGNEVIMEGIAYMDTTTIEELQHYAQDAGESDSIINAITEPEIGYNFMASGVIVKAKE